MERCKLCGKKEANLLGPHCMQCDRLIGDIYVDLATEF